MKIKKIVFSILIFCLLFTSTVNAASNSVFSLVRDTSNIINYNEDIVAVPGSSNAVHFPLKYSENGHYLVFCTGDRAADTENSVYHETSFINDYDGAIVAAIIDAGVGENATLGASTNDIFFTQLAIWKSLPNTGTAFPETENALSESQRATLNNLINVGAAAKNTYNQIKSFNIALSSNTLTFTLDGDIYKSQVINVSGDQLASATATVNKGTVEKSGNSFVVKVPKNELLNGDNRITLSINAKSNSIPIALNYSNGNSSQQTTTITNFIPFYKSATKSISGVVNETSSVRISKQDATTGGELPGATLELKKPDGSTVTWISDTIPKVFENLTAGEYILTEIIAPEGYIKSTETITFTVNSNGGVDTPIIMKNQPKAPVSISKQDATTGKELPGAKLVLKDSEGNIVDEWTSGKTPHTVSGLTAGKYTLTETLAPEGYIKSTETVTFTVKSDGTVDNPVIMKNKPKDVIINPPTGSKITFSLLIAFVAFAVAFYFYADYKLKGNM